MKWKYNPPLQLDVVPLYFLVVWWWWIWSVFDREIILRHLAFLRVTLPLLASFLFGAGRRYRKKNKLNRNNRIPYRNIVCCWCSEFLVGVYWPFFEFFLFWYFTVSYLPGSSSIFFLLRATALQLRAFCPWRTKQAYSTLDSESDLNLWYPTIITIKKERWGGRLPCMTNTNQPKPTNQKPQDGKIYRRICLNVQNRSTSSSWLWKRRLSIKQSQSHRMWQWHANKNSSCQTCLCE